LTGFHVSAKYPAQRPGRFGGASQTRTGTAEIRQPAPGLPLAEPVPARWFREPVPLPSLPIDGPFGTAKECIAVNKYLLSAAAVAILAGVASFQAGQGAFAQNQPAAAAGAPAVPHRIGLIDMAYVFKNYKKFEALRESLKSEIEQADREAKAKATQVQKLQEDLKSSPFKPGSPEYNKLEADLTQLVAEFETFRKSSQREFLQKEANIYKTIYLEVTDTARLAAEGYKFDLVLRFNRETIQEASDPKEILNSMNHQVIYHQQKNDITLSVLNYLNDRYSPGAGSPTNSGPPRTSRRP
jgi:Skp family chaperone for outer membrane proteins